MILFSPELRSSYYLGDACIYCNFSAAYGVNFYGSYDFNKDNKVTAGSEFFDVGGLMSAAQPKANNILYSLK